MPYLSVVIPFYNEKENLSPLVKKLNQVLSSLNKSFEVIFIDDGSTDDGFDVLKELIGNKEDWRIIRFRKNFGQTAAWAAGLDYATGQIVVIMDADLENSPQDIPLLLSGIDRGFDVVSGWRKDRWMDKVLTRRITSKTANWLISKISGVKLHDFGCSLRAYRREILEPIKLYGEMHRFLPILTFWQGAKITEVEVSFTPRKFGQSKYGTNRIVKVILDLVVIRFLSGYATNPIYFFGKIGLYSIIISILAFITSVYYKFWGDKTFIETPLPVLTALFFIVGVLFILIGVLAEMTMRIYYESANKRIYSIKDKINFH